jgi:hypothetical protein
MRQWLGISVSVGFSGSLAITGCAVAPDAPPGAIVLRVPSGSETAVTIDAPAGADCTLHGEGPGYAGGGLPLHADDRGALRFHVRPDPAGSTLLALDCQLAGGGATTTRYYEVEAGAPGEPLEGAAAPHAAARGGPVRPALNGDAEVATNAEIVTMGFPPRPDRSKAPKAYARWLEIVSKPAVRLTPRFASRAGRPSLPTTSELTATSSANGPTYTGTSSNWCGYTLVQPKTQYWYVEGEWTVPSVVPHSGWLFGPWYLEYSTQWVGLDGLGTSDVVQAGSQQDTYTIAGLTLTNYFLWTENYPAASLGAQIGVDPGDLVDAFVWVGDGSGDPDVSGGYGWYYLYDSTQGTYAETSSQLAAPFSGATAEWIVERPSVPFVSYGLANFGHSEMSNAYAFDTTWTYHDIGTDVGVALTMMNGHDELCYTYATSAASAGYVWTGYN